MSHIHTQEANQIVKITQPGLNDRVGKQFQGKALGGSSTINGSAFIAPSQAGIDAWAQLGNPKWTYDALLPFYKTAYSIQPPDASICKVMGIDHINDTDKPTFPHGPIQVSFPSLTQKNPMAKACNEVFRDMGYKTTADLFPTQGAGNRCYTAATDPQTKKRMSADSQYGRPASTRPNLTIITEATVLKILFSGSSPAKTVAKGVEVSIDGDTFSITANKEVILSAGAFHTAKLLELSAVGEPSRLRNLAIPLVIENASVGENLQNHVMRMRTFELDQGVKVGDGIQSLAFLPLLDRVQQKETFDNAPPPASRNEKDFYDVVRGIFDSRDEASCSMFMSFIGLPNFASFGVMQSIPFSHGNSHITSANPDDNPRIDPRFFSNPLDLEIMAHHLLALEKLPSTSPLSAFFKNNGQCIPPNASVTDLESARKYLRENAVTTHHSCGTAAMLPRENGGVVDQDLVVYGTRNLRVVDASMFPVIPQANPISTVYAVAERAADLIKGVYA
jgi:choline dehydrogenase-like flavoprotein